MATFLEVVLKRSSLVMNFESFVIEDTDWSLDTLQLSAVLEISLLRMFPPALTLTNARLELQHAILRAPDVPTRMEDFSANASLVLSPISTADQ